MTLYQTLHGKLSVLSNGKGMTFLAVMSFSAILLFSGDVTAQTAESTLRTAGQESTILISLWWIGSFVIGLALAYGIWRTWSRTRADKQRTERATKELYAEEQRRETGR
jgi:type VI protein secretion system component VasK